MKKTLAAALATVLLAGIPGAAQAALVPVNVTLDASGFDGQSGFFGLQGTPPFSPPFSVNIAEGDTFDYTIDFLGDQTLTLTDVVFAWAFSYANETSDVTGTGTFSFLDANGVAILTSGPMTSTEGNIHFGQQFSSGDFVGGLPASITFSGVRYVGVLDDYVDDGVTTKGYASPALYFSAGSYTVGFGAVPEPSAWALMILGFGLAGTAMRRRKATVSYA